jgi:hypothetical protein
VYLLRSFAAIAVLVVVIVYTVANTHPIYSTTGPLGTELRKVAPGLAATITPGSSPLDQLMASPQFQEEKQNFYEDLMRLKQLDSARADSIAQVAVREAYVRGISPAIIFGVMLTENAKFMSTATSNVGAVGLMQVYPKVWLTKELAALFGKDIKSDSTNVKYGVFILSHYFRPMTKSGQTTQPSWQKALLAYNGCVRGTNTRNCYTYPAKVQRFVENSAKSICGSRGFYECIAKPFIAGLFGATNGMGPPAKTTSESAGSITMPAVPPAPAPVVTSPPVAPAKATPSKASSKKTAKKVAKKPAHRKAAKSQPIPKLPKPINIVIPSS